MDNFRVIYKILKILEAALDYEEFNPAESITARALNVSEARFLALIMMMQKSGYIKGVLHGETLPGTSTDISGMKITMKGLEYLYKNAMLFHITELPC
jgi:hypothetical protein